MQNFITLFLFICCIILFCIVIFKKYKIEDININTKEENNKLEIEKLIKTKELEGINHQIEISKKALKASEELTKNINAAAHEAFTQYQDSLDNEYIWPNVNMMMQ